MLVGRVVGRATSTIKHPSLERVKLLVVMPVRSRTAEPVLALDRIGAGAGDLVVISSDGQFAREFTGDDNSPARWTVVGLIDDTRRDATLV